MARGLSQGRPQVSKWGGLMNSQAAIKIDAAKGHRTHVEELCLQYIVSPNKQDTLSLGASFGDLANDLRSALNYTMRLFIDEHLKLLVTSKEYEKIQNSRKYDFPWAEDPDKFVNMPGHKPTVGLIQQHCPNVYRFLEQQQTYSGNERLKQLMMISNQDKHVGINVVDAPLFVSISGFAADGKPINIPKIMGNQLVLTSDIAGWQTYPLPCYFAPLNMFATSKGWTKFFVEVDDRSKDVLPFADDLISYVEQLVEDFEALI
jgi:hypothetical protein